MLLSINRTRQLSIRKGGIPKKLKRTDSVGSLLTQVFSFDPLIRAGPCSGALFRERLGTIEGKVALSRVVWSQLFLPRRSRARAPQAFHRPALFAAGTCKGRIDWPGLSPSESSSAGKGLRETAWL